MIYNSSSFKHYRYFILLHEIYVKKKTPPPTVQGGKKKSLRGRDENGTENGRIEKNNVFGCGKKTAQRLTIQQL